MNRPLNESTSRAGARLSRLLSRRDFPRRDAASADRRNPIRRRVALLKGRRASGKAERREDEPPHVQGARGLPKGRSSPQREWGGRETIARR